jgi:uncharacterized membrane protein
MELKFNLKKNIIIVFLLFTLGNEAVFFNIPVLRQIAVFIFLTFLPGYLFLRTIRLKNISFIEYSLYSVGMSITILMFSGLLLNFLLPYFGINNPITEFNVLMFVDCLVLFLFVLSLRNNNYKTFKFNYSNSYNLQIMFLSLIPLIAISGALMYNLLSGKVLLFLLIIIISIIPLMVVFNKISKELYPFLVLIVSISLILHWTLISPYIVGSDINYEHYFALLTYQASLWNPQLTGDVNAMLSITILAPIYSKIMNLSLVWVLKLLYPCIYALVPLGLYKVFEAQLDNKKMAFLSVFYFMAIFPFFSELLQLGREEIAELYLVLLILIFTTHKISSKKWSLLAVIFTLSIVVSHYGVSYIYILILIIGIYFLPLINKITPKITLNIIKSLNLKKEKIGYNFVFLFLVFAFAWYMYVSNSSGFSSFVGIFNNIYTNLITGFFQSSSSQGLNLIVTSKQNIIQTIYKYLYLGSQFLIFAGLILYLANKKVRSNYTFSNDYLVFSVASMILLILAIILPFFASAFNTTRLYHVTLFFLAPFVIIGTLELLKIFNITLRNRIKNIGNFASILFSIFLLVFLLFNTGLVTEVSNNFGANIPPFSIALSDSTMTNPVYTSEDVAAAYWIRDHSTTIIYTDGIGQYIFAGLVMHSGVIPWDLNNTNHKYFYFYLRSTNINKNNLLFYNKLDVGSPKLTNIKLDNLNFYNDSNKIYESGGSQILFVPN